MYCNFLNRVLRTKLENREPAPKQFPKVAGRTPIGIGKITIWLFVLEGESKVLIDIAPCSEVPTVLLS